MPPKAKPSSGTARAGRARAWTSASGSPRSAATRSRSGRCIRSSARATSSCTRSRTSRSRCEPGEFFGIVGRNGSGKSTLLKCLAGIYRADEGQIWCNGRMSTFIELGVGFNPDLAAYDNVTLNGIMLGLSPREARARYQRVIEFAELEEFQDLKLKNYSSGMHVRLAFSVAIQVDADILLIDEVLAVGDAAFQQKCFDVFNRMREEGRTIVFVTHDMGAVTRFCHRAMLLERGEMVSIGDPRDVADRYLEIAFGREVGYEDPDVGSARMGDGAARVSDVWLGDDREERRAVAPQSEPLTLKALVSFNTDVLRSGGEHDAAQRAPPAGGGRDDRRGARADRRLQGGREAVFAFSFHNMLAPGRYHPILTITHRGDGLDVIDRFAGGLSFVVSGMTASGGMVEIPVETEVSPRGQRPRRGVGRPSGEIAVSHAAKARRLVDVVDAASSAGGRMRARAARHADPRATRARRQLVAVLAPRLQHRAQRIQTEVLRLGARLPVAGDAPAAAVRRAVRVLRRDLPRGQGQGAASHFYGAQLLGSIVLFTFFGEATSGAVRSVVDRENLVRKIQFPRLAIPISVVLLALFNLA